MVNHAHGLLTMEIAFIILERKQQTSSAAFHMFALYVYVMDVLLVESTGTTVKSNLWPILN